MSESVPVSFISRANSRFNIWIILSTQPLDYAEYEEVTFQCV